MSNCLSPDRLLRLLRDDATEIGADGACRTPRLFLPGVPRALSTGWRLRSGIWHDLLALLRDNPPGSSLGLLDA